LATSFFEGLFGAVGAPNPAPETPAALFVVFFFFAYSWSADEAVLCLAIATTRERGHGDGNVHASDGLFCETRSVATRVRIKLLITPSGPLTLKVHLMLIHDVDW
jgi:hypothetical protein